ncbi:MAG: VPLPA-CTERM sorting domain-containing protein [Pseudomonadota bacterium]
MKKLLLASVSAGLVGAASMSSAATLDFEQFDEGEVLGAGTVLGGGIVADISAIGGVAQAVVFDTAEDTDSTDNDPDLETSFTNAEDEDDVRDFGNSLIVQENDSGGPDDNGTGGTLIFEFMKLISLSSVYLLDAEEETTATLYRDGNIVLSFTLDETNESDTNNNPNNNEFTFLDFGDARGDELVVTFARSGAVGELEASIVPVPAGLPLLLGGIGAFAWVKRRKRA